MIVMALEDWAGRIRHDSGTRVTAQVAADIEADIDTGRLAPIPGCPVRPNWPSSTGWRGSPCGGRSRCCATAARLSPSTAGAAKSPHAPAADRAAAGRP
jgi:hypothetical protein